MTVAWHEMPGKQAEKGPVPLGYGTIGRNAGWYGLHEWKMKRHDKKYLWV